MVWCCDWCDSIVSRSAKQWLAACGREDLSKLPAKLLNKNYWLCAEHFHESQFYLPDLLRRNALPTIFGGGGVLGRVRAADCGDASSAGAEVRSASESSAASSTSASGVLPSSTLSSLDDFFDAILRRFESQLLSGDKSLVIYDYPLRYIKWFDVLNKVHKRLCIIAFSYILVFSL